VIPDVRISFCALPEESQTNLDCVAMLPKTNQQSGDSKVFLNNNKETTAKDEDDTLHFG